MEDCIQVGRDGGLYSGWQRWGTVFMLVEMEDCIQVGRDGGLYSGW